MQIMCQKFSRWFTGIVTPPTLYFHSGLCLSNLEEARKVEPKMACDDGVSYLLCFQADVLATWSMTHLSCYRRRFIRTRFILSRFYGKDRLSRPECHQTRGTSCSVIPSGLECRERRHQLLNEWDQNPTSDVSEVQCELTVKEQKRTVATPFVLSCWQPETLTPWHIHLPCRHWCIVELEQVTLLP